MSARIAIGPCVRWKIHVAETDPAGRGQAVPFADQERLRAKAAWDASRGPKAFKP